MRQVAHVVGEAGVVGEHGSAAASGHDFVAVEAQGAHEAHAACGLAVITRADCRRCILQNGDAPAPRQLQQAVHVAKVAQHMHGHDRADGSARTFEITLPVGEVGLVAQEVFQQVQVELQVVGRCVDQDRLCARMQHGIGGGDKTQVGADDEVVFLDAERQQGQVQGRTAAVEGDREAHARKCGNLALKVADVGSGGGDPARLDGTRHRHLLDLGDVGDGELYHGAEFEQNLRNLQNHYGC